jgi:hypothetical protein
MIAIRVSGEDEGSIEYPSKTFRIATGISSEGDR